MAESTTKLVLAVGAYLDDLRRIRASGGGTDERSYYPPLTNLLNAVGAGLRPKVFCVSELAQQGAGTSRPGPLRRQAGATGSTPRGADAGGRRCGGQARP